MLHTVIEYWIRPQLKLSVVAVNRPTRSNPPPSQLQKILLHFFSRKLFLFSISVLRGSIFRFYFAEYVFSILFIRILNGASSTLCNDPILDKKKFRVFLPVNDKTAIAKYFNCGLTYPKLIL